MNSNVLIVFFLLHTALAGDLGIVPSNTQDGEKLCFSVNEKDMAWPLINSASFDALVFHSVHCMSGLHWMTNNKKLESDNEKAHLFHCKENLVTVSEFLDQNRDLYKPLTNLCDDIRTIMFGYAEHKRAVEQNKRRGLTENQIFSFGASYDFSYPAKKRKRAIAEPEKPQEISKVEQQHAIFQEWANIAATQGELFGLIASYNTRSITTKEWRGHSLTPAERNHFESWHTPMAKRLNALGAYCMLSNISPDPATDFRAMVNTTLAMAKRQFNLW